MKRKALIFMLMAGLCLNAAAQGQTPSVISCLDFFGGQGSLNVNSWNPGSTRFAFVSYRLAQ